jgi:hypothetical protein
VAARTLLALSEHYRKMAIEPADRRIFEAFVDRQQEVVHVLARALRQASAGSGKVEAGALGKAEKLEIPKKQIEYLRGEVKQAVERYRTHMASNRARSALWEELTTFVEDQRAGLG